MIFSRTGKYMTGKYITISISLAHALAISPSTQS
jgi:hypothetical protein